MPPVDRISWADHVRALPGKRCLDTSRLFADPDLFRRAVHDLAEPFAGSGVTKVAALDALGFALGGGVAYLLGAGLVHVRKGGRSMWHAETSSFRDYSGLDKTFEVVRDAVGADDTVLVVDDWSETGTQLRTAMRLLERLGATVVGAALLHIDEPVRQDPFFASRRLHHLFDYP